MIQTTVPTQNQNYPKIINNNELNKVFSYKGFSKVKDVIDNLFNGKSSFVYNGTVVKAVPADIIRVFSESLNEEKYLILKNLLLHNMISSENRSIASSLVLLNKLSNKNEQESQYLSNKRCEYDEIKNALLKYLGYGMCYEAVLEIFSECGHSANVGFTSSYNSNKIVVKSTNSVRIPCYVHEVFVLNKFKLLNCKLLYIDGFLDSLNSISELIDSSAKSNENIIIIARQFDIDLVNTLSHNHGQGKLNIIPLVTNEESSRILKLFNMLNANVIELDNMLELKTLSLHNLIQSCDILFENDHIKLNNFAVTDIDNNINFNDNIVEVMIPKRLMHLSGLIEDRILSGLSFCRAMAYSGVISLNNYLDVPIVSHNIAEKTYQSFNKSVSNLSLAIVN